MGKKRKTLLEVKSYIEKEGYKLLSEEYINCNQDLDVICPNGHNIKISWKRFENGRRCPNCSERSWINRKKDISHLNEIALQEGYEFLDTEYKTAKTKMKCSCPNGHIFEINWNNFKSGKRCPHCKKSKGEDSIKAILEKLGIKYKTQYKFDDCRDVLLLPFDFYLYDYNLIIEYDGEQHFDIKRAFNSNENKFWETVVHDAMKNAYCEDNNIDLLRIPFWEFDNIEKIIKQKLSINK